MTENTTTYEPDNSLKKKHLTVFREIFDEIKKNRWLIYQLFKKDFITSYRQSVFGVMWAFIVPLISVFAFALLSQSNLFNPGNIPVPFVVYALFGLAFWQLFSAGVIAGSYSLVSTGTMISRINFSKKALVIASMGKTMVSFLIQLGLALASLAVFGFIPNIAALLIPLLIIPLILFTVGLSFLFALLNVVVRDIGNVLPIASTFLLFLTPIMYAVPVSGLLSVLTTLNPLYYLISVPRDLALTGSTTIWLGFLVSSILSVIVFVLCLVGFHSTETRLAERI